MKLVVVSVKGIELLDCSEELEVLNELIELNELVDDNGVGLLLDMVELLLDDVELLDDEITTLLVELEEDMEERAWSPEEPLLL
jgi:hypothetical protein